jgi:hypothetical protein
MIIVVSLEAFSAEIALEVMSEVMVQSSDLALYLAAVSRDVHAAAYPSEQHLQKGHGCATSCPKPFQTFLECFFRILFRDMLCSGAFSPTLPLAVVAPRLERLTSADQVDRKLTAARVVAEEHF